MPKVDEAERIATKIESNQNLIDAIKKDEQANSADFKVMSKAQSENEKLAQKLEGILNKKVTVETKKGTSVDLNEVISEEMNENEEMSPVTLAELDKALNEAGIPEVTAEVNIQEPAEVKTEPSVEPIAIATPTAPVDAPKPVANNAEPTSTDPLVSNVINAINNAKALKVENETLISENQRLSVENKDKDAKITSLGINLNTLSNQNQTLVSENQKLSQTNASQAVSIANLSKENQAFKASIKNQAELEQKINGYEDIMSKHEKERSEMAIELEGLRRSARDNQMLIQKLETDMRKIEAERNLYSSQISSLKKALGFVEPVPTPNVEEQNRVR
jgi:hypothetical protein